MAGRIGRILYSLPIPRREIDATQEGYQNAVYRLRETEKEVEDIGFLTLPEGQGVIVISAPDDYPDHRVGEEFGDRQGTWRPFTHFRGHLDTWHGGAQRR